MSYWAATVITNVIKVLPFIGESLYEYVVGGHGIGQSTLTRAFVAHVVLGIFLGVLILLHVHLLHTEVSNNPLGTMGSLSDSVSFHSSYTFKDAYLLSLVFIFFCLGIWYNPNLFSDPESFIEADSMVTPSSIKPEWYFLPFYAMLRAVESKQGGIIMLLVFFFFLWLPVSNWSSGYCLFRQVVFWSICGLFLAVGFIGGCHPEEPYITLSRYLTFFMIFLLFIFKFGFDVDFLYTYFTKSSIHLNLGLYLHSKFSSYNSDIVKEFIDLDVLDLEYMNRLDSISVISEMSYSAFFDHNS